MTPDNTDISNADVSTPASETPAYYAAWFAPAAATAAAGAALVRMQMSAFNAWREMLRVPSIMFPPADPDTARVAVDNMLAEAGRDPASDKDDNDDKKSEKELDEELAESFPASDPPSHNPGSANPPTEEDEDK